MGLVTEEPFVFGGTVYTARRNEGEGRWQVFADGEFAPAGYIELHRCDLNPEQDRLMVFDVHNQRIGDPKPGRDDGCVGSYMNALSHIRMRRLEQA